MPNIDILLDTQRLVRRLTRFSRPILWALQLAAFLASGVAAFLLRFDFAIPNSYVRPLLLALCAWSVAKLIAFRVLDMGKGWWRYVTVQDLLRLGAANLLGSAIALAALLIITPQGVPRSVYILDFILCSALTAGMRLAVRLAADFSNIHRSAGKKRTLIYGAGDAGVTLLREIRQNPALSYDVVGFIDDDAKKTGSLIYRVKVFGEVSVLPDVVKAQSVETILIAMPSATGAQMTRILQRCQEAGVSYKTVPGLAEVIESNALASQIRDVAVEDLLGRNPVRLEQIAISAKLENQVVLVTGAAGSIGSELCRQIARFRPRAIVGYEIAETALFHLDQEMRRAFPEITFHPEIGSIQNPQRLADVLQRHSPSILYHAAAYKHVPMMEAHIFEAVENNIFGTWNVALAAARCGVSDFVMISSDKAVRPTSVMGLTKRVAELLMQSLQHSAPDFAGTATCYVAVRFGNVLGSNGSVIPIFKSQIARGGPVTVTHPEMRRYFMTIPEASQLVLQASSMGSGGEVFVLDMGQPVRIVDLARNLILLSGLRPDHDIRIEFTGPRPGEKLYEELSTLDEETLATCHEKIKIFDGNGLPPDGMIPHLEALRRYCEDRDARALILHLKDLVPDYNPSTHILRRILQPEAQVRTRAESVAS
jgi:FlaA1/EpsC-like NDP-sugar epimerase